MSKAHPSLPTATAIGVATLVILLLAAAVYFSARRAGAPQPGSAVYDEYAAAFHVGVAALDAGLPQVAQENLSRAVELVPQEPAGWANRGLLSLRTGRLEDAAHDLEQAASIAPEDPEVEKLLGLLEQRRGQFGKAASHLRKALAQHPNDVKAIYLLAQIVDQEQLPGSDEEYQRLMERIVAAEPDNLLAQLDLLRTALRRDDRKAVDEVLRNFERLSADWKAQTRSGLAAFKTELASSDGAEPVAALLQFSNLLRSEPAFPRSAEAINPQDTFAGDPLQTFRWLAPVKHSPAPPDEAFTFEADDSVKFPEGDWSAVQPAWMTADGPLSIWAANDAVVQCVGEDSTIPSVPSTSAGLVSFDANNDLRMDLLAVGSAGLKLNQQQADGSFRDVTSELGLPEDVVSGDFFSAWPADVDLDGDLDLILARTEGPLLWLRNALDGTFAPLTIFEEVDKARELTWSDLDNDGAPDVALLDAPGKLHVFTNERSGRFKRWFAPPPEDRMLGLTTADVNDDGVFDLVALREDGALLAMSPGDQQWEKVELGRWEKIPQHDGVSGWRLLAEDFDNNGVVDFLASAAQGSQLWLGSEGGKYSPLAARLPSGIVAAADLRGAGRLDLLGIDEQRQPFVLRNKGSKDYRWQTLRPQAAKGVIEGDNRINSFGIGGEIEIRSGTHVVKQPIRSPLVHFGLGERKQVDVVRIVWPNGAAQYEFKAAADEPLTAIQRLKGSCPFLFAWNGERFEFVTDFMWSSPLGMYINAADKGGFLQTTDWVKVPGDQLVAKDGKYELRVNANLWETHFFDQLALMVVDHPADTEMFVDERFCLEPSEPNLHLTEKPQPVAEARDHLGQDATQELRANDGVYLDRCGRGLYQGITSDHWVEVELGEEAANRGPLWLVARGWIHPTDSSINYAIEQGQHVKPQALVLEVPDSRGGWKVARNRIGFPAGKNKTVLLRLDGLTADGVAPRRFRLRTNMEIYWDSLQIARGNDDSQARRQVLFADRAELRFRGIVAMSQANPSSPEVPHYDELVSIGQPWRDLVGYHTRFGEIGELLAQVDDRYAILNAGDDVALAFAAPSAPPPGWRRDFVMISDGWVKDGDMNTRFGKSVLPLPAHDMASYDTPPSELEADPVYRRYPEDWQTYHTRYVTPHAFERGLRGFGPRKAGRTSTP